MTAGRCDAFGAALNRRGARSATAHSAVSASAMLAAQCLATRSVDACCALVGATTDAHLPPVIARCRLPHLTYPRQSPIIMQRLRSSSSTALPPPFHAEQYRAALIHPPSEARTSSQSSRVRMPQPPSMRRTHSVLDILIHDSWLLNARHPDINPTVITLSAFSQRSISQGNYNRNEDRVDSSRGVQQLRHCTS